MTKTPQWAVDLARDLNRDSGLLLTGPEVEEVARKFAEVVAGHASTDPIREKAGELVWAVQHAGLSSPAYWKIREIARELKTELEG